MFGLGWTEMLVIGVVALIVIGPKDLPVVMNRIGKALSAIRKMGGEFQREINKASGLDQVADLRKSITEPLKQTAAQIRNEFNKPLSSGGVEPSGAIKPKDPKVESVVGAIHEKIGLTPPAPATAVVPEPVKPTPAKKAPAKKAVAKAVESPAPAEAIAPVMKPATPRKAKAAAPKAASATADLLADLPPVKATKPRKPRAAKTKSDA